MTAPVCLTRGGVVTDAGGVERLRGDFDRHGWVRLPGLLDPPLLAFVLDELDRAEWAALAKDFFSEQVVQGGAALRLLVFLTNSPRLLDVVHAVTACGPFSWFDGRIYRMAAGGEHYDDWHDDFVEGRRVALSLNLNRRPYGGGHLYLRRTDGSVPDFEIRNTMPGDAILFRLSKDVLHRVDPVRGPDPKTAFAGWFNDREPDLLTRLRRMR